MKKNSLKKWRFIPSLKGKQAKHHVFILRTLATRGPKSCWDLALESVMQDPKLNLTLELIKQNPELNGLLKNAAIYHKRQRANSTLNKRLRFLESKHYVKKSDSLYKIAGKGLFLMFALDPRIVQSIPEGSFNEIITQVKLDVNPQFLTQRDLNPKEVQTLKSSFGDEIKNETLSFIVRKVLLTYKINMDEITEKELLRFLFSMIEQEAKKRRKKRVKC